MRETPKNRCVNCGKIWVDHFDGNFCDRSHAHEEDEPRVFTLRAPEALPEESANDRYERLAEMFCTQTGMMAPGKDVPAAMGRDDYELRAAAWKVWCAQQHRLDVQEREAKAAILAELDACAQAVHAELVELPDHDDPVREAHNTGVTLALMAIQERRARIHPSTPPSETRHE